jgi:hypothetical protein
MSDEKLQEALAEHFGVTSEDVGGFVLGVEYRDPSTGSLHFKSVFNYRAPWDLKGFIQELRDQIRQHQAQIQMDALVANTEGVDGGEER